MVNIRINVKIFLASPSDLQEERRAAKSVVEEFNNNWADNLGYQIELVGWEDTISAVGRPQSVINRDLDQCELFIGVMWKRWGTPPNDSGPYTSGFEEEFEISMSNLQERGSPEISLFFKNVDADLLRDPGDALKKVIAFKKKITTKRTILFQTFDDIGEFQSKIRSSITRYVQDLKSAEDRKRIEESQARSLKDNTSQSLTEITSSLNLPLSTEGANFLRNFISKTEGDSGQELVSTSDVARFRLLASKIGILGNDRQLLGVHDSNILFVHRSELELSTLEQMSLIDSSFAHYSSKSTPLWYWITKQDVFNRKWLQLFTLDGTTEKRVGAISAMRLVSESLSSDVLHNKDECISSWFSEIAPSALKVAALEYLAECGTETDLNVIESEVDRADSQITTAAVDAILRIKARNSRESAILALFELQPPSVKTTLLSTLFENGASIGTAVLRQGVTHRSRIFDQ